MNKLLLISVFFLIQVPVYAQSWSVGIAGIYGDDIASMGAHVRGYYNFKNEKICFGPEYSYFLEQRESGDGSQISGKLDETCIM